MIVSKRIIALSLVLSMCFCTNLTYAEEIQDTDQALITESELNETTVEEDAESELPEEQTVRETEVQSINSEIAENTSQADTEKPYYTDNSQIQNALINELEQAEIKKADTSIIDDITFDNVFTESIVNTAKNLEEDLNSEDVNITLEKEDISDNVEKGDEDIDDTELELASITASGSCGDNVIWELDNEGTFTISGSGDMDDYSYGITPWDNYKSEITNVVIQDGVTSIGSHSFKDCTTLVNITIPESMHSIGVAAFYNCASLYSIIIPNTVASIGDQAFNSCVNLKRISLPNQISKISYALFYGCSNLSNIIIPDSVNNIEDQSFQNCTSLEHIIIPGNVQSIGRYAFGWSGLKRITIMEGVSNIGYEAFTNCINLRGITIPQSVEYIDSAAFNECYSLADVTIQGDGLRLTSSVFYGCNNLEKVAFLGSTISFDEQVFSNSPTIYCYEYSDADSWATQNGYPVVYFDDINSNEIRTISIEPDFRIACGEAHAIGYTVFPNDNPDISWSSSDPSVVMVEDGIIYAKAIGTAVITAAVDGLSASVTVETYEIAEDFAFTEEESAEAISINVPESIEIGKYTVYTLDPEILPLNADQHFYVESSNPDLVQADISGIGETANLVGVSEGHAIVNVRTANGLTASTEITVLPVNEPTFISLNEEYTMKEQDHTYIYPYVDYNTMYRITVDDYNVVSTFTGGGGLQYNGSYYASSVGLIAQSPGTTTFTIETINGLSCKAQVTVIEAENPTSITIPAQYELKEGDTWDVPITLSPEGVFSVYSIWADDSSVVTTATTGVGDGCRIFAKKAGKTNITILTRNQLSSVCEVTVTHDWEDYYTVDIPPTCSKGLESIHCRYCGETKDARDIDPVGHDWGKPEWKWTGNTAAATFTCQTDKTHIKTIAATMTSAVGTGEDEGYIIYTATVEFNGETYTDVKSG